MELNERNAKILLLLVISVRATSFCFSKVCLQELNPYCLLGLRFTLAFILLCLLFHKRLKEHFCKKDILKGFCFGILYFLTMLCEYSGLPTIKSSTAAFIENLAIVIVPFLNIPVKHSFPNRKQIFCAFLAIIGIGLLTLKPDSFLLSVGELFLLGAAFFYALAIITTSVLSTEGDSLNMGIYQVGTIGLLSLISATTTNTLALPTRNEIYLYIAILAVLCTGLGFTLQPVAQSKLKAEETSVMCAVSPFVASVIGLLFLGEQFSCFNYLGALLILITLYLS